MTEGSVVQGQLVERWLKSHLRYNDVEMNIKYHEKKMSSFSVWTSSFCAHAQMYRRTEPIHWKWTSKTDVQIQTAKTSLYFFKSFSTAASPFAVVDCQILWLIFFVSQNHQLALFSPLVLFFCRSSSCKNRGMRRKSRLTCEQRRYDPRPLRQRRLRRGLLVEDFKGGLRRRVRRRLEASFQKGSHPSRFSEVPLEAPLQRKRERLLEAPFAKREAFLLEASFKKGVPTSRFFAKGGASRREASGRRPSRRRTSHFSRRGL